MLNAWLRERTKPERWLLAAGVALMLLILGTFLRQPDGLLTQKGAAETNASADSTMQPRPSARPAPDVAQRLATLDNNQRAIEDGQRECRLAIVGIRPTSWSAWNMLANRELLRAIRQMDVLQMEGSEIGKMLANAPDGLTSLRALGLGRFAWGGNEIFVDRTNIFTRHQYPVPLGNSFALRDAVDIVSNKIGVGLTEFDPFRSAPHRVWWI